MTRQDDHPARTASRRRQRGPARSPSQRRARLRQERRRCVTSAETGKTLITIGAGGSRVPRTASTPSRPRRHHGHRPGNIIGTAKNGVVALSAGGNILIDPTGTITGGTNGVSATTTGAGTVTVTTTALLRARTATACSRRLRRQDGRHHWRGRGQGFRSTASTRHRPRATSRSPTGNIVGTAKNGVVALSAGGNLLVNPTGTITGGTNGVSATRRARTVTVTTTGAVEGKNGDGVFTSAATGKTVITIALAESRVPPTASTRRRQRATSRSPVRATLSHGQEWRRRAQRGRQSSGQPDGYDHGGTNGVSATTTLAGTITVTTTGLLRQERRRRVHVGCDGQDGGHGRRGRVTGSVTASTRGGVGAGDITVVGSGAITGTTKVGLSAQSTGGNVTIAPTGVVTGGTNGVVERRRRAASLTSTLKQRDGEERSGVIASAVNGAITIDTAANKTISATATGIDATSTGTGGITINNKSTIPGRRRSASARCRRAARATCSSPTRACSQPGNPIDNIGINATALGRAT